MAELRLIAMLAAGATLGGTARADAPRAEVTPPAGWRALPKVAAAISDGAKADGVTIEASLAWGDPARGCFATWLALRGSGAATADQVVASLAGSRSTMSRRAPAWSRSRSQPTTRRFAARCARRSMATRCARSRASAMAASRWRATPRVPRCSVERPERCDDALDDLGGAARRGRRRARELDADASLRRGLAQRCRASRGHRQVGDREPTVRRRDRDRRGQGLRAGERRAHHADRVRGRRRAIRS